MKKFLIILLLFLIPLAQAEAPATSYWGYVTVDSIQKTNALVTVLDSSGKEVARATTTSNAMYQVTVPWDDSTTQADEGVVDGETLNFNVGGKTAASKTIDTKGTNNRFDLTITSSSTTTSSGTTASPIATASSKTTTSPIATISPETTTSPPASPDVTAVTTEKLQTPTPAATKTASGFGVFLAIAGLMAVILRKRGY